MIVLYFDNFYACSEAKNALKECLIDEQGVFKARKYWYNVRYYEVNNTLKYDEEMKLLIDNTMNEYNDKLLDNTIGTVENNLDCTQFSFLNGECNSSNLVTDIIRNELKTDCVILSARSFLSDENNEFDEEFENDKKNNELNEFPAGPSGSTFNIDGSINKGKSL